MPLLVRHAPSVRLSAIALVLAAAPSLVAGHPHVEVRAGLSFVFDAQGRLTAIRQSWTYDRGYSHGLIDALGLDPEGDGVLTAQERLVLGEAEAEWPDGYDGDLYVTVAGFPAGLSGPEEVSADLATGLVSSIHTRRLLEPWDPARGPVEVRVYDPYYYAGFALTLPVTIEGRSDCAVSRTRPDPAEAEARTRSILGGIDIENPPHDGYPSIGQEYAETLRLECPA